MSPHAHPPLTPFGSALAGALGSVFANSLVYPLDVAKTRLQALDDPLEDTKSDDEVEAERQSDGKDGQDEQDTKDVGTAEESLGTKPRVPAQIKRDQLQKLKLILSKKLKRWGILTMLLRIFKTEGLRGCFHGFVASMIGTFSQQFTYFFFHTLLRKSYIARLTPGLPTSSQKNRAPTLSTAAELFIGALAGALAQVFTIPVSVIATRQQLWDPPPHPALQAGEGQGSKPEAWQDTSPSLLETAQEIVSESGYTGLWTGLKASLVLTVNPAITYGVFERLKSWRLATRGVNGGGGAKLGVGEAFWIGVGSKTLATVVTYPYIFAKVRLQARSTEVLPELAQEITKGNAPTYAAVAGNPPMEESASTAMVNHHEEEKSDQAHSHALEHADPHLPAHHYRSAIPLLRAVYQEKGLAGLYQGLGAQILKAVLCQGITFVSKDQFESYAWLLIVFFMKMRGRTFDKA